MKRVKKSWRRATFINVLVNLGVLFESDADFVAGGDVGWVWEYQEVEIERWP